MGRQKNAANAIQAARRVRREQKRGRSGLSPHFSRGSIFRAARMGTLASQANNTDANMLIQDKKTM